MGLTAISVLQPFCISFMVLLWIGDEKFKSYLLLHDMQSLRTSGSLFDEIWRWTVISLFIGICSLIVAIGLSWRSSTLQGIADYVSSMHFTNQLKRSFVIYYSMWFFIYWFEITVVFFGYIGKFLLMLYNKQPLELDINSEHNTIGLCLLIIFVVLITMVDFIGQDILDWRAQRQTVQCQRQE